MASAKAGVHDFFAAPRTTRWGGDRYGAKRRYVEIDYLARESERKRARYLVVNQPPGLAPPRATALLELVAQAEPPPAPRSPPGVQQGDRPAYAYDKEVRSLLDAACPERQQRQPDADAALAAITAMRPRRRYAPLELPRVPEQPEASSPLRELEPLPVDDDDQDAPSMHSLLRADLEALTDGQPAAPQPAAVLQEALLRPRSGVLQPLELPLLADASDAADDQISVECLSPKEELPTPKGVDRANARGFAELIEADLTLDLPPKPASPDLLAIVTLPTVRRRYAPLELPLCSPMPVDAPGAALERVQPRAIAGLTWTRDTSAPSLNATLHELCAHDFDEILAHSKDRLCLRPIPPPSLEGIQFNAEALTVAQLERMQPRPTETLELHLKLRRSSTKHSWPCIEDDLKALISGAHAVISAGGVTKAAAPALSSLEELDQPANDDSPAPIEAEEPDAKRHRPPAEPDRASDAFSGTAALPPAATPTPLKAQDSSSHSTSKTGQGEAPQATPRKPDTPVLSMASETPRTTTAKPEQGRPAGVEASSTCAIEQSEIEERKPSLLEAFTARQSESSIIPQRVLSKLVSADQQGHAGGWQSFQAECGQYDVDTRGLFFQYCAMVDDVEEEVEADRPRAEQFLATARARAGPRPKVSRSMAPPPARVKARATAAPTMTPRAEHSSQGPAAANAAVRANMRVARKRKLKSGRQSVPMPPINLNEFISAASGSSQPERSDVTVPSGVSMCRPQLSLTSTICNCQSTLVALPLVAESSLHSICLYNFVANNAAGSGKTVLWLSEDTRALAALHTELQSFCEKSKDCKCHLVIHHTDIRSAIRDADMTLTTPDTLDLALRHDASLPRMIATTTSVVAVDGVATALTVLNKYNRVIAPWLAEAADDTSKTALVFSSGALPESGQELVSVLRGFRLDRIVCRKSTDPDIKAFCQLKYPSAAGVATRDDTKSLIAALQSRIAGLADVLDISTVQTADLSYSGVVSLANEAAQHVRTAFSTGDLEGKTSWSDKYRKLVELLTCLQTFEAMADHSIDAALKGLQSTLADGQQAAVLKGSVDQLLEQTQRLASQASIGSTVTKMSSLCQTLQQEQARMQLPEMTDALAFLSQPKFRALVQVANEEAAQSVLAALQPLFSAVLLDSARDSAGATSSNSDVHICVRSTTHGSGAQDLYGAYSVVVTMCESADARLDPLIQQLAHSNRIRHITIAFANNAVDQSVTEPATKDSVVEALRSCSTGDDTNAIAVDDAFCAKAAQQSAQLTNALSALASARAAALPAAPGPETELQARQQPPRAQTDQHHAAQAQQDQSQVIVSNGCLGRNDVLSHLEANGVGVVERDNSMTGMDLITSPATGCVLLALSHVQACGADVPTQAAQSYMQNLSERLLQACFAFNTVEVIVEHGVKQSQSDPAQRAPTTAGVQRLIKLVADVRKASSAASTCKYRIRHSIGDPREATPKQMMVVVHAKDSSQGQQSEVAVISSQPSAEEAALVRSSSGAINPWVSQALLARLTLSHITRMRAEDLHKHVASYGVQMPLTLAQRILGKLEDHASESKPGLGFLGRSGKGGGASTGFQRRQ